MYPPAHPPTHVPTCPPTHPPTTTHPPSWGGRTWRQKCGSCRPARAGPADRGRDAQRRRRRGLCPAAQNPGSSGPRSATLHTSQDCAEQWREREQRWRGLHTTCPELAQHAERAQRAQHAPPGTRCRPGPPPACWPLAWGTPRPPAARHLFFLTYFYILGLFTYLFLLAAQALLSSAQAAGPPCSVQGGTGRHKGSAAHYAHTKRRRSMGRLPA